MTKYLYLAAALVFLAAIGVTGYLAYNAGIDHEKAASSRIIEEERERQKIVINKLEAEKAKRVVEYRDKIKVVRITVDPTGCADTDIAPPILDRLLPQPGSGKTGRRANSADDETRA